MKKKKFFQTFVQHFQRIYNIKVHLIYFIQFQLLNKPQNFKRHLFRLYII